VLLAYRCALASDRVSAAGTEASEFAVAADRHGVSAVPAIVANDRLAWVGNVPERQFVANLLQAAGSATAAE
jgi:predicted DsbA family dithiol-disulfide isomerase